MTQAANQSWTWVDREVLLAVHDEQLAEHGGAAGLRDESLLDSALARPRNLLAYGGQGDAASLAAAYAFGIARNHPFIDGNKRTAYVAAELFLMLNGLLLTADDASATLTMLHLAAGDMGEDAYADWLRAHLQAYQRAAPQKRK